MTSSQSIFNNLFAPQGLTQRHTLINNLDVEEIDVRKLHRGKGYFDLAVSGRSNKVSVIKTARGAGSEKTKSPLQLVKQRLAREKKQFGTKPVVPVTDQSQPPVFTSSSKFLLAPKDPLKEHKMRVSMFPEYKTKVKDITSKVDSYEATVEIIKANLKPKNSSNRVNPVKRRLLL